LSIQKNTPLIYITDEKTVIHQENNSYEQITNNEESGLKIKPQIVISTPQSPPMSKIISKILNIYSWFVAINTYLHLTLSLVCNELFWMTLIGVTTILVILVFLEGSMGEVGFGIIMLGIFCYGVYYFYYAQLKEKERLK
jgi:hypothetical protein